MVKHNRSERKCSYNSDEQPTNPGGAVNPSYSHSVECDDAPLIPADPYGWLDAGCPVPNRCEVCRESRESEVDSLVGLLAGRESRESEVDSLVGLLAGLLPGGEWQAARLAARILDHYFLIKRLLAGRESRESEVDSLVGLLAGLLSGDEWQAARLAARILDHYSLIKK